MRRWFTPDYGLLLALLLPLFAVMPLLTHAGLPNTADGPAHLMRQVELNQAWQEGNFYPRWGRDLAYGHGMPIFSYAPPALYQLTQLFHLSGLPLDAAMKAVLVFDFLLYSLGMFLFARRLFGPYPALVAAALYVYAPYRLREAYIQGNYGQFTGLAFYPLIFWAFHGLLTTRRPGYLVAAAASLAGLLFSHNISFMLFAPMFGAYLLFLLIFPPEEARTRRGEDTHHASRTTHHALLPILAALLLGLGLAAIFWLPAFGERHEIQLAGITRGFFDFRENFISLSEFFSPPLPLDLAAINPKLPLSLGLPQIIGATIGLVSLLLVGFLLLIIKPKTNRPTPPLQNNQPSSPLLPTPYSPLRVPTPFFAFFLLLYAFLALPQSQPLWEAVPLLELAEFPWRMLGPAIFCASLVAAGGFTILDFALRAFGGFTIFLRRNSAKPNSNFLFLISYFYLLPLLLTLALNAYYLYPSQFIRWGTPTPTAAFAYEVTSGAIGTTSTGEFLPRYARQHPRPDALWPDYAAGRPPQKIDPATLPPGATVEITTQRAESDTFQINTPQEFTATLRTLYWPGWQVYLDEQPTPFTITDPTGLIQTRIPAGQHTLTLQLESTPLRTTGQWLTLLSTAILVTISGFAIKQTRKSQPISNLQSPISNLKGTLRSLQPPISNHFFALTATLLILGYLLSRPLAPLFTLQSDPDQPQPAEQALQVDFGTGQTPLLRLVGADSPPQAVKISPGEESELTATLYWRALQKLDTNYSVFLHLDAPDGKTLATADEGHPENIPTRNWPTGLYLRNPLHLQIPPDLPPIRYELNAGLYDPQTQQRLTILPGGATTYSLGPLWLVPPQPALPQTPLAHFGPAITLWQSDYSASRSTLTLFWQTSQPLEQDDAIFIHLLDAQGNLLAQADGAPYAGLYPLIHWLPGQIITDTRSLPASTSLASIAVGLYNPATGDRLPATAAGQPLPDNRLIIPVKP